MGSFELSKASNGQFRFVLKADNGLTILTSELYVEKASALNGIESVKANSGNDARFERKVSTAGSAMFNLKAANGEVIGTSQQYSSTDARDDSIESVQANGPTSDTKDLTEIAAANA